MKLEPNHKLRSAEATTVLLYTTIKCTWWVD